MPATLSAKAVVSELKTLGKPSYRKVMLAHGAREPLHGVSIADMKQIQKRAGGTNHALALELWDTGVYDAMYLAALLADDAQMGPRDLQHWVDGANCKMLWEYAVPWVACGSPQGWKQALKWIDSRKEHEAAAGWATLGGIVSVRPDEELDLAALKKLLARVEQDIHAAPNRARYAMNSFVISVGCYVKSLTGEALAVGKRVGKVEVDMGDTACKVPVVADSIAKVKARGAIGKKRKDVKC
jgi:hypothetical protein